MKLPSSPAKRPTKTPAPTRTSTLSICRKDTLKAASRNESPQATTRASSTPWMQSCRIVAPYPPPGGARTVPKTQPINPAHAPPTMQYQTKSRNDMDHSRSRRIDHVHFIRKGAGPPRSARLQECTIIACGAGFARGVRALDGGKRQGASVHPLVIRRGLVRETVERITLCHLDTDNVVTFHLPSSHCSFLPLAGRMILNTRRLIL